MIVNLLENVNQIYITYGTIDFRKQISALCNKENLCKFIYNGRISLINSRAKRAVKKFAVHRKNRLFADTVEGAKANAVYCSLIEFAKANKLNIYKYIRYLLEELLQLEEV